MLTDSTSLKAEESVNVTDENRSSWYSSWNGDICLVVLLMCHFYCIYYSTCERNKWRWRCMCTVCVCVCVCVCVLTIFSGSRRWRFGRSPPPADFSPFTAGGRTRRFTNRSIGTGSGFPTAAGTISPRRCRLRRLRLEQRRCCHGSRSTVSAIAIHLQHIFQA